MNNKIITFIGAGNMSRSLVSGLLQESKKSSAPSIRIADPEESQILAIQQSCPAPIQAYTDNNEAISHADVVVLAVKPQLMKIVCKTLKESVQEHSPLIISIAAGISIESISTWLGGDETLAIVRCMPNTPSLVQSGMTGLYANKQVTEAQHDLAENILRSVGSTLWLSTEDKLDAVTAVSGSGPAYFFLVMEAMQDAAQELGLTADEARLLVLQTAFGASKLALESSDDAHILRQRVTSKGGTTEAALNTFIEGGLPALFSKALKAASDRSVALKNS